MLPKPLEIPLGVLRILPPDIMPASPDWFMACWLNWPRAAFCCSSSLRLKGDKLNRETMHAKKGDINS